MQQQAYTKKQFSEAFGISISKLDELRATGDIASVKVGKRVLITHKAAMDWLDNLPPSEI